MQADAPVAAASAADPAATAAAGAAAAGAAGDAAIGAAGVQEPPSTSKIVMQSILKGAMTGASVTLGIKGVGPTLMKVGFVSKLATPAIQFLSKLPLVGKVLPFLGRSGIQGFLIAGAIGAGVGAIFGAIGGLKKAKAAAAEYAEAMAQQQAQTPVGDPVNTPGASNTQAPPVRSPRFKNWVIAYSGSSYGKPGATGTYKAKKGDTVASVAKRFHTSVDEIKKLNPSVSGEIKPGTTLKLKRKVVKKAA